MSFDEEVDEVRSHEPLNLLLNVNRGDVRKGFILLKVSIMNMNVKVKANDLHMLHMSHDILEVSF